MVCFLGSRLNLIEFEKANSNDQDMQNIYPIKVEYNRVKEELVVATRKDVRFINIKDGRLKYIFSGLLKDNEIAQFKSINQFKMFIIGDQKGKLKMFNFSNGEEIKQLNGHKNEVSNLKIDYSNKLIISSSWDSSIII